MFLANPGRAEWNRGSVAEFWGNRRNTGERPTFKPDNFEGPAEWD